MTLEEAIEIIEDNKRCMCCGTLILKNDEYVGQDHITGYAHKTCFDAFCNAINHNIYIGD